MAEKDITFTSMEQVDTTMTIILDEAVVPGSTVTLTFNDPADTSITPVADMPIENNAAQPPPSGDPYFKSSFDLDVAVVNHTTSPDLQGTDQVTGMAFELDLPGKPEDNYFNFVINDYNEWANYVDCNIVDVTNVPNSTATKALYIAYKADDPNHSAYTRVQYDMLGDDTSDELFHRMNQGYIKYKTIRHYTGGGANWDLPVEMKDTGDDGFRIGFYIYDIDTTPRWVAKGQYMVGGELGGDVWEETVPDTVPIDEWFELELYWEAHSDPLLGRFMVAINGVTIFNVTNQTKDSDHEDRMYYFMPFKIYGPIGDAYITDFEMYEDIPSNSVLAPLYNSKQNTEVIK